MYESIIPLLVQMFIAEERSVMLFAFGHKGSGKTPTMLRTDDSLETMVLVPCGESFLVCTETQAAMKGKLQLVTALTIEFYM